MCIAIAKKKEAVLTKAVLSNCYRNNPDGCGFCYPSDDASSVIVKTGYFSFEKFWKDFSKIQKNNPALIHFRIGTSGIINKDNCHPFLIDERHALIHNGNLEHKLKEKLENSSDTRVFVENYLRPIFAHPELKDTTFWAGGSFKWLMEEMLGLRNKIAILNADGIISIYNQQAGEWEKEVWFSNDTYRQDRKNIKGATTEILEDGGLLKEKTTYANGKTHYRYLGSTPPKIRKEDILTQSEIIAAKKTFDLTQIY